MLGDFQELGYLGPAEVLSEGACQQLASQLRDPGFPPPLEWNKGHAATSRAIYDVAVSPPILDVVEQLLGRNVVLWGATIVQRPPGSIHPWHSDMESSADGVQGVTVWLGLEHTSEESSLQLISRSHRLGLMLQDARQQRNIGREESKTEDVLQWARDLDARCEFVKPAMSNGQALFFDGRLWHYSENRSQQIRVALLLQYATANSPVKLPDYSYLDRPFRTFTLPQPPCLLVRGEAPAGVNRIVQAPPKITPERAACLRSTRICDLGLPLPTNPQTGFRPFHLFRGQTPEIDNLSCHVSSLTPGSCPHPPHRHPEEEILLVLDGEIQVVLPDIVDSGATGAANSSSAVTHPYLTGSENAFRKTLRRGEFVYYPAQFTHTLINAGHQPANYLMFKWVNAPTRAPSPLSFVHYNIFQAHDNVEPEKRFSPVILFETPTAWLRKLHCHISNVAPGKGHSLHHDAYDVAIVLLEGEVETAGVQVGPNSVIFWPMGEPHQLVNPGTIPARYVVFEFHSSQRIAAIQPPPVLATPAIAAAVAVHAPTVPPVPPPTFLTKLRDPERWKRKLKHWADRIHG